MNGFLGTGATFSADLNLVVQVAMGVALLFGWRLARKGQFQTHKYCQSTVIVLNLVMIALIMAPSLQRQVFSGITMQFRDSYYVITTLHAALGTMAALLGIYIVLSAGTGFLPRSFRLNRYKPWMRTEIVLWWMVVLIGIGTYIVWYGRSSAKGGLRPRAEAARAHTVTLTNFKFTPSELTIPVDSTVEWVDDAGRHTIEADDGSFKSTVLIAGGHFEYRFDRAGRFPYHCTLHGDNHGKGMVGVVNILSK